MTRALTEADKRKGFMRATGGFARSRERWAEHAARGLSDTALAEALAREIGIFGGSCGPGELWLTYQGAGLKLWISWDVSNHVTTKPTFEGRSTIAMARLVHCINDPADKQLTLL